VPIDEGWEDTHGSGEDCTCNSQEKHQLYEVSNNALGKEITQSDGFSIAWLLNKTKDSLFNLYAWPIGETKQTQGLRPG